MSIFWILTQTIWHLIPSFQSLYDVAFQRGHEKLRLKMLERDEKKIKCGRLSTEIWMDFTDIFSAPKIIFFGSDS